jgi:1,2-dihydroxy-3-keto-5-methylthiopentene dioxygenase
MSRLTVYQDKTPGAPRLRTEEPELMAATLNRIGVRFERWDMPAEVSVEDSADTILDAFRPHLDALMGPHRAGSADVVRMNGQTEAYPAIRQKFIEEHTHTEDEIRFFVHGGGNFILHVQDEVFDIRCEAGDLISVPAGIKHWYDGGEMPFCTVLRVFTHTTGWVPHYTGEKISALFPAS